MLIYGVKISDIKKYNDQKAERFFDSSENECKQYCRKVFS